MSIGALPAFSIEQYDTWRTRMKALSCFNS